MLSIYPLKSASEAAQYYQTGDYYTQGASDEHSQWVGKGALRLSLKGPVQFDVFKSLLEGRLPNGVLMTQVKRGEYHRPGYDLTFSAPKSVSILALVAGNQALLQAHREAVQESLEKIERKYAGCRNKDKGVVTIERTNNFTIATFEHSDSRAGDPNLHTHAALMNITQRVDGEWRTIFADEIFDDKLLNGMEYRSSLAHKIMRMGFEIEAGPNGTFEIKGVPGPLMQFFSKRRGQIEHWMAEHGQTGGEAASRANLLTRPPKVLANPEERTERWRQETAELGESVVALQALAQQAIERGPVLPPDLMSVAKSAVQSAVQHLTERQNTFSFQTLMKTAQLNALLPTNEGYLLNQIEQKITDKSLIYLDNQLLTTAQMIKAEQDTITAMQTGQRRLAPLLPKWVAKVITSVMVDDKIKTAVSLLLSCQDRHVLLASNSTLLLTQTLKSFLSFGEMHRFYPRVLTQTQARVAGLQKQLNTESVYTLEGFLRACEARNDKRGEPLYALEAWARRLQTRAAREVWIVHSSLSSMQLNWLTQFAETLGARIVLTQTQETIPAVEPLKKAGLTEITLLGSQHQIAGLTRQEHMMKHLKVLARANRIQEVSKEERLSIAAQWHCEADGRVLVSVQRSERAALNTLVRQTMQQEGHLQGEIGNFTILRPLNFSTEEKRQLHLYQPGDMIRFNQSIPQSPIERGSYGRVQSVNLTNGRIELSYKGASVLWHLQENPVFLKQIEVFRQEPRELQRGDIISWTRTVKNEADRALSQIKGGRALVTALTQDSCSVRLDNGATLVLQPKTLSHQHWDYGYAVHPNEVCLSAIRSMMVLLPKQPDSRSIDSLALLLTTAREEKKAVQALCHNVIEVTRAIEVAAASNVAQETRYDRANALANDPAVATNPLFNRLQTETIKILGHNPDIAEISQTATPGLRVACDLVDQAAMYHAERDAVFTQSKLENDATLLGGLRTTVADIEAAVALAIDTGWLVKVGAETQEVLLAAKPTLVIENLSIKLMEQGKNQLPPVIAKDSAAIGSIRNHPQLTQGQKEAVELILTTTDRIIVVQGIAGAGKTTALKAINRICSAHGFSPLILANTANAKNQAATRSNLPSQTTAQFLTRMETKIAEDLQEAKQEFGQNRLLIVDESSLASSKEFVKLQKIAQALGTRLSMIGDFKQQGSIGAGTSHHDLLAYGVQKAVMQENVRLTDSNAFLAMKQAYAGDMAGALTTLHYSIEELPVKQEALQRLVQFYMGFVHVLPEPPLVITPLNADRKCVNNAIREQLKEKGLLDKQGLTIDVFVPTDKREVDKSDIFSYERTDVIRFNTNHPRFDVKAGDYARIIKIDCEHHRLTLQVQGKSPFYWQPKNLAKPSGIEIYRTEERELSAGDTLIFRRNNERQGIFNGDKASLLKIENNIATLKLSNDQTHTLDLTQPQNRHVDHGYAVTTYAAQGKDVGMVIAYGSGPQSYTKQAADIKVGDSLVFSRAFPNETECNYSIVTKVIASENGQLTLQDRDNHIYTDKADAQAEWEYFPPFEQRKTRELPLSTSQQSFLIQISRGDNLILIVPCVEDFQKTLEAHQRMKRSALSYTDPNWQTLSAAVDKLVAHIKGKAEKTPDEVGKSLTNQDYDSQNHASLQPNVANTTVHQTINPSIREPSAAQKSASKPTGKTADKFCSKSAFIDKDELNERLEGNLLGYASEWLGKPNMVSAHEARWGKKGSFSLKLTGPQMGAWSNWETGQKGMGLISLYKELHGISFKDALKTLAKIAGLEEQSASIRPSGAAARATAKAAKAQEALEKERQLKIQKAQTLYNRAIPIERTGGTRYFRMHRGIPGELPEDFRYLIKDRHFQTKKLTPAIIAPYRDKDNQIVGVVKIYLDNDDGKKYCETFTDAAGRNVPATSKVNVGISSNGAVVVQEGATDRVVWIAEGVETALSVAKAKPNQTVLASLSVAQIANVPLMPETRMVVICADNDPAESKTKGTVVKAVESFLSKGVRVFIALPPPIPKGMGKYDFNDVLKEGGVDAVDRALERMVEIKDAGMLKTAEPRLETDVDRIRLEQERSQNKTLGGTNSARLAPNLVEKGKEIEH